MNLWKRFGKVSMTVLPKHVYINLKMRVDGVYPSLCPKPKNQLCQYLTAGENGCLSSGRRTDSPLLPLFVLFRPLVGWMMSMHWWGWASLLSLLIQILTLKGKKAFWRYRKSTRTRLRYGKVVGIIRVNLKQL